MVPALVDLPILIHENKNENDVKDYIVDVSDDIQRANSMATLNQRFFSIISAEEFEPYFIEAIYVIAAPLTAFELAQHINYRLEEDREENTRLYREYVRSLTGLRDIQEGHVIIGRSGAGMQPFSPDLISSLQTQGIVTYQSNNLPERIV